MELERKQVSILTLSWTVVHPLDDDSPLRDMTMQELQRTEASFSILLKAFNDTFSQTICVCIVNGTFFTTVNNAFIYKERGSQHFVLSLNPKQETRQGIIHKSKYCISSNASPMSNTVEPGSKCPGYKSTPL